MRRQRLRIPDLSWLLTLLFLLPQVGASAQKDPMARKPPIKPDETGLIPVLMYHSIGDRGPYDRNGLNIAPATFRKHLQMMYRAGWYPINMRDALTARLNVPAGKIPVVLTFDDGRGSQFQYRKDGSIDPHCAVGILEAFHRQHPDWPLRGTFYVLTNHTNPVPFYQRGMEAKKLRYLIAKGFEIGNHSATHGWMNRMNAKRLQWEVAECIRYIRRLAPGATMDTFCIPYGARPRTKALVHLLLQGRDGSTAYYNRAVLNAWGGPTYPFVHKRFDRAAVPRIGAEPGNIEAWIQRLRPGSAYAPFISDGDPNIVTVPRSREKTVDARRLEGAQLAVYKDGRRRPRRVASRHKSIGVQSVP